LFFAYFQDSFVIGIGSEGNLTWSVKSGSPPSLPSSIFENVADGSWHSLLFNGSSLSLGGGEGLSPIVTFDPSPSALLRFFDGFVGCIKLSSPAGDPLPSQNEDGLPPTAPEGTFSFTDYFQLDTTPPYSACADLSLDLAQVHHCPDPPTFLLCDKCQHGARCEVIEEDESLPPSNYCFCTDRSVPY
jgi:hypothetical protein